MLVYNHISCYADCIAVYDGFVTEQCRGITTGPSDERSMDGWNLDFFRYVGV